MAGPVKIAILANGSQAKREFNSTASTAKGSLGKLGSIAKGGALAAVAGLALAGAAAVKFGASCVSAASDAQQSVGATETVFGKFADTVIRTSDKAAKKYGLSANVYRQNANLLGALLKNQGVETDQLAGKTQKMIGIGSDLAATFGGTTSEAVEALGSAFKGEFDTLERYGVSLKQSTVNTEAMRVANVKSTSEFGKLSVAQQTAARQQATTNLILKQSADSAGAFGRESDTLAHKQQVLGAQFDNIKAKIGNAFLPIVSKAVGFLSNNLGPAFRFVSRVASQVGDAFRKSAGDSDGLGGAMRDIKAAVDDGKRAFSALWPLVKEGGRVAFPILVSAIKQVSRNFRIASDAAIWLWNKGIAPTIRFATAGFAALLDGIANVLETLASVPGAPKWIGELASKARGAADDVRGIGAAVRDIPSNKNVTITTTLITKRGTRVENGVITGTGDAMPDKGGASQLGRKLAAALFARIDTQADREIGQLESGVLADVETLNQRITEHFEGLATTAADNIAAGFDRKATALEAKFDRKAKRAKKRLEGKAEDKALEKLEKREQRKSENLANQREKNEQKKINASNRRYAEYAKNARANIARITSELVENARQQDVVNAKLEEARDRLQAITQEADNFKDAIAGSFKSAGSVIGLGVREMEDGSRSLSGATLLEDLAKKAAEAEEFARLIDSLAGQGLGDEAMRELLAAGPEAGLDTARALAQGGKAVIDQVNALKAQMTARGEELAARMREKFYGAGERAAQGVVEGLIIDLGALQTRADELTTQLQAAINDAGFTKAQQAGGAIAGGLVAGLVDGDRLSEAGRKVARRLVKAVKEELGIKSPSRVFRLLASRDIAGAIGVGFDDAKVGRFGAILAKDLTTGFGAPRLDATAVWDGLRGPQMRADVAVTLTAEQLSRVQQGREITLNVAAFQAAGGRSTS